MTTITVAQPPASPPDPAWPARAARYRAVYALAVAERGWPPDPHPL